jgi:hypothetical protein
MEKGAGIAKKKADKSNWGRKIKQRPGILPLKLRGELRK